MFASSRVTESWALCLQPGAAAPSPDQNIRTVVNVGPPKSHERDLDQGASTCLPPPTWDLEDYLPMRTRVANLASADHLPGFFGRGQSIYRLHR